jgi:ribonuclease HI
MTNNIEIFSDGGARGNPGPAAIGVVIDLKDEKKITISKAIGKTTNNVAEYTAVVEATKLIKSQNIISNIDFFLDSELVVKQLNGVYKVKDENLKKMYFEIKEFVVSYPKIITFNHIRRENNKEADKLVNKALDEDQLKTKS